MSRTISDIKKELGLLSSPENKNALQWFFKTGKGQYGEGDVFLGVKVPDVRSVVKKHKDISFSDIKKLLDSEIHEMRQAGLMILVHRFPDDKKAVYDFYMKHLYAVNNWDLVDLSAHRISGAYLADKDKSILYTLARSKDLWARRVAVLSCFYFINDKQFEDAFRIAEMLLDDKHDLIHKAVGWMLREIGKRDQGAEEAFLKKHHKKMSRTMLRYSIERFDEKKRKFYMQK